MLGRIDNKAQKAILYEPKQDHGKTFNIPYPILANSFDIQLTI